MNNKLTRYQEWYYAWDLNHRKSISDDSKFTGVLSEARVDLNPHQVDAALFAFNSPFSKGAILADETGLGKTIEAGIILSQMWASNKRRIIIVVPASLRLQWSIELYEKFFLPTVIMDSKLYQSYKVRKENPLNQKSIIICSYNFCAQYASEMRQEMWDLVVFDEAHKLRNVYMAERKQLNAVAKAFQKDKKILLTATPLQNSLKELYGLISIIDNQFFSSQATFSDQYNAISTKDAANYGELKARVQRITHRTLRNQVTEYVNYTKRIPIVQDFTMTDKEIELYNLVSEYLDRFEYGFNKLAYFLVAITIRKILASSARALTFTMNGVLSRLYAIKNNNYIESSAVQIFNGNYEIFNDEEDDLDSLSAMQCAGEINPAILNWEIEQVEKILKVAYSIEEETKAIGLVQALAKGFEKIKELGANKKALIFTESVKTQEYLLEYLEAHGYENQVICFNGTNNSPKAMSIYRKWLDDNKGSNRISGNSMIDKKQALVDYFKDNAQIMIATEAGAEGINLQFCSMMVNYDMPWNPQRIEQRIGRCHRYGQKFDVVVVNFVNKSNYADQRVYDLLSSKFQLFDAVFGCSDEVLGALESGIDIERRVGQILRECRTDIEIKEGFDRLQAELEEVINARVKQTKVSLLENFDEEVIEKLKFRQSEDSQRVDRYNRHLWKLAISVLENNIDDIDHNNYSFQITRPIEGIPAGIYSLDKDLPGAIQLRVSQPVGQYITMKGMQDTDEVYSIEFNQTDYAYRQALLEEHIGSSGWANLCLVSSENSLDGEEVLISSCITDEGEILPNEFVFKLFEVDGKELNKISCSPSLSINLNAIFNERLKEYKQELELRTTKQLEYEIEKYESWESDQLQPLEKAIIELNKEKETIHRLWRKEANYKVKAELLLKEKEIKVKIAKKNQELDAIRDEYELKVDQMAERLNNAIANSITHRNVMTFRWTLI